MRVTYEKIQPHFGDAKEHPDCTWRYHIEEADEDVNGFAGGLLRKTSKGLWQALYWKYALGEPAKSREQAILNILPLARMVVEQWRRGQQDKEKEYESRRATARALSEEFTKTQDREVTVHDVNAPNSDKLCGPPKYTVTVVYTNLTAERVKDLARRLS